MKGKRMLYLLLIAVAAAVLLKTVWKRPEPVPATDDRPVQETGTGEQPPSGPVDLTPTVPTPPASVDPAAMETERDWGRLMTLPTLAEIEAYNGSAVRRSPYLAGWLSTDDVGGGFVDYFADFRAEFLPCATYCCLANFDLDYSALEARYADVRLDYDHVAGYAGFQRLQDGSMKAIMSLWDVHCTDAAGAETTVRAKLVYPRDEKEAPFSGEGTGAQYIPDYDWQAGRWYRMILHCDTSETTGNTTLAMWAVDLATGEETLLCIYDLGVPDVCFRGSVAVFLENFDPKTAGDVRSMECRNFAVNDRDGYSHFLKDGYISENYEYPGSYRYGADGDTFWFITTGVPGKAGAPQEGEWLELSGR